MLNVYTITTNGQQIEIEWTAKNTGSKAATNVVGDFELPTNGLSYVSHTVASNNGIYSPSQAKWTVGTVQSKQQKSIKIKYSIDDISYLNMSIYMTLSLTETDVDLTNNNRRVYLLKQGASPCDPANFVTPVIQTSDDNLFERAYIGQNDVVSCPCCNMRYEVVDGTLVNITVDSITQDGWANIVRTNPQADSFFDYVVVCDGCPDGAHSSVTNATVKINKLFVGRVREYEAVASQSDVNNPVASVSFNTLGATVVWTRESTGSYLGTAANSFVDSATNCYVTMPALSRGKKADLSRVDNNTVRLTVFDVVADDYVDADTSGISIWIRVNIPQILPSISPTRTVTRTASITPTITITPSITRSITVSASISVTPTRDASLSVTVSETPSISITPSITFTSSITPSISVSISESITVSITISPSISLTPP